MQISTLLVCTTTLILFFAFVINNVNNIYDVLSVDAVKLNQTKVFVETRNDQLTDIDLINLEIH